jgi:hypothetical protein
VAAPRVYSTRFIGADDSNLYSYTCPDGFVALLSTIDVYVGIVLAGGNFTGYLNGEVVFWSQGFDAPGEQNSSWRGKVVLTAGESFQVTCSDTFACVACGDLLLARS